MMLQQDTPEDFVIATGETHSVREFLEAAFQYIGKTIVWEGSGKEEVGKEKDTGIVRVKVNESFFRPTEVVSHSRVHCELFCLNMKSLIFKIDYCVCYFIRNCVVSMCARLFIFSQKTLEMQLVFGQFLKLIVCVNLLFSRICYWEMQAKLSGF